MSSRIRSRAREAALTAALLGASLLGSLLLFEGAMRFMKRDIAYQPDPDLIRSLLPEKKVAIYSLETADNLNGRSLRVPEVPQLIGYTQTNDLGLRMAEDVGPRQPGEKRILLLGDSFTEALECLEQDRFAWRLSRLIAESGEGGAGWRVLNGGIQNGSPAQYVLQLRRLLPLLEPDIVVVVTGANDLFDDTTFERDHGFVFDGEGLPVSVQNRRRLWWLQHSFLLRYGQVFVSRYLPDLAATLFPPVHPELPVPPWTALLCDGDAATREAFRGRTGRYLVGLRDTAEAAGAKFAVLVLHYLYSFREEPFYEPRFPTLKRMLAEHRCYEARGEPWNQTVDPFLARQGIVSRNIHGAVLEAKRREPRRKLWNFYDYHFSPAGHELVARELYALLQPMLGAR